MRLKAFGQGFAIGALGGLLVALLAIWMTSCSPTIAPRSIHQTQAAHTSTGQDSGMLRENGATHPGFKVNAEWLAGYDALLARYGSRLTPPRKAGDRAGIKAEGDRYRIGDEVMERQQAMNQWRVDRVP